MTRCIMDIQKRLDFLLNNQEHISKSDQQLIARVYLKAKAKKEAKEEENKFLQDLKFSNFKLISKKINLNIFKDSLYHYHALRNLEKTPLTLDDLSQMISSELRSLEEHIEDNQESENIIYELLNKK